MMNYNELIERASKYLDERFPHHAEHYTAEDLLHDMMWDANPQREKDGITETKYFVESKYEDFGNITEFSKPVYDEDGEIEDWEVIGYEIG